jgi:polysaccharide export outer membrane protein
MKHRILAAVLAALAACVLVVPRPALAGTDPDKRSGAAGPVVNDEYRLGPGDKLRIEVYKDPQLSQSLQIRPDGKITLPLIGDIMASGSTSLELRDAIAAAFKDYITNPTVTVIVVEAVASQIYVMGEVAKAGALPLNGPTTVLQALAMAGGFKDFANTKNVKVLRPTRNGVETLHFNYKDAVNGDEKPFFLKSGDTVIVP